MKLQRSSGILLHITSLPGQFGSGTLGPEAYEFADTIQRAGLTYWQILPIGPVDPALGFSPYATVSTFAGNWLFISLERLADEPWADISPDRNTFGDESFIDFPAIIEHRLPILRTAGIQFFKQSQNSDAMTQFRLFCRQNGHWLNDFSLFQVAAEHFNTNDWLVWDGEISLRNKRSMRDFAAKHRDDILFQHFLQFIFFKQWRELKNYCTDIGISIIGDIPIYITLEGADAWSHRNILQLDRTSGKPLAVSGVPPDYFSETGQRWGNPLYRWRGFRGLNGPTFRWWARRINHLHGLVDYLRIDHFRGFAGYWSIPADEETAINGQWVTGPGIKFFNRLRKKLGDLPLIAEDLGVITPDVEKLRDDLELPGMKILQFAFDFDYKNYYLPHNITNHNCILYTGTHDNNTTNGWYYGREISDEVRDYIREYLGIEDDKEFSWQLIRQAFRSVANLIIFPAQDILGFGSEFKMNRPGTVNNNWRWKLTGGSIDDKIVSRLKRMGEIYSRLPA